ncbi:hypothetical protein GQ42DRAFT_160344 [Ramicandelaber brevisporus]|nr:hypothetical protein GQ42DRAFT_160344 [Ramicandelaber brevisporus]
MTEVAVDESTTKRAIPDDDGGDFLEPSAPPAEDAAEVDSTVVESTVAEAGSDFHSEMLARIDGIEEDDDDNNGDDNNDGDDGDDYTGSASEKKYLKKKKNHKLAAAGIMPESSLKAKRDAVDGKVASAPPDDIGDDNNDGDGDNDDNRSFINSSESVIHLTSPATSALAYEQAHPSIPGSLQLSQMPGGSFNEDGFYIFDFVNELLLDHTATVANTTTTTTTTTTTATTTSDASPISSMITSAGVFIVKSIARKLSEGQPNSFSQFCQSAATIFQLAVDMIPITISRMFTTCSPTVRLPPREFRFASDTKLVVETGSLHYASVTIVPDVDIDPTQICVRVELLGSSLEMCEKMPITQAMTSDEVALRIGHQDSFALKVHPLMYLKTFMNCVHANVAIHVPLPPPPYNPFVTTAAAAAEEQGQNKTRFADLEESDKSLGLSCKGLTIRVKRGQIQTAPVMDTDRDLYRSKVGDLDVYLSHGAVALSPSLHVQNKLTVEVVAGRMATTTTSDAVTRSPAHTYTDRHAESLNETMYLDHHVDAFDERLKHLRNDVKAAEGLPSPPSSSTRPGSEQASPADIAARKMFDALTHDLMPASIASVLVVNGQLNGRFRVQEALNASVINGHSAVVAMTPNGLTRECTVSSSNINGDAKVALLGNTFRGDFNVQTTNGKAESIKVDEFERDHRGGGGGWLGRSGTRLANWIGTSTAGFTATIMDAIGVPSSPTGATTTTTTTTSAAAAAATQNEFVVTSEPDCIEPIVVTKFKEKSLKAGHVFENVTSDRVQGKQSIVIKTTNGSAKLILG